MAQIVYYVTVGAGARRAGPRGELHCADRQFRRYLCRLVAKRMGVPIDRLIIATNDNDILDRTLKTGRYEVQVSGRAPARPWTSRSRAISSACCSRPMAAMRRRTPPDGAASASRAPLPSKPRPLEAFAPNSLPAATDVGQDGRRRSPTLWRRRASSSILIRRWAWPWREDTVP